MSDRTVATVVNRMEHRGRSVFEFADMRGATQHLADVTAACGSFATRSMKSARQQSQDGRKYRFSATDDGFRASPNTWTRHTYR